MRSGLVAWLVPLALACAGGGSTASGRDGGRPRDAGGADTADTGPPDSGSCVETGCEIGQRCNAATGACEAPARCEDVECGPFEDCVDGRCVDRLRTCDFRSTTHGEPRIGFDVGPTSDERLRFVVPGLPAPARVASAELRFDSFDADHPGEEGFIRVNGDGPWLVPADLGWDGVEAVGRVDVTGATVEGDNSVEFCPGPLARTYFEIGDVELILSVDLPACP